MKRTNHTSIKFIILSLVFSLLFVSGTWGQGLYISQYIETNSGSIPKGVEIFNETGSDIILSSSNYLEIYQGTNGAACTAITSTKVTSGTLKNGEVWVIGTSDLTSYANSNGLNLSGTTTYAFAFNGDDALELYLGTTLVDVFGTCGTDPGSSWSGGGVSTANQNIQILCGVGATTTFWTDPSVRFEVVSTAPASNLSGFGNAPSCTPVPEIQAQMPTGTDVACGFTYDYGIQTTGTNTNQTLTIVNTGTADLDISSFPLTGTDAAEFSISPASTSTTISSGGTYDIGVTFSPTTAGTKSAEITINSNDGDEAACVINLTGEGIAPCVAPTAQPTVLDLTINTTITSIDGTFTAASPAADSYLVVYSTNNTLSATPVNGTTYAPGDALGGGTVLGNISGTSFTASGLTQGTEYYFFIFSNNNATCAGGPLYLTSSPLSGNEITVPDNVNWTAPGCVTNSSIQLNWDAAPGNSTGYMLVVRQDATPHAITALDPNTQAFDTDYSAAPQFGSTVEYSRVVYKGTATSVTITNLPTANCTFKMYTYTIGSSDYIYSSGTQQTNNIGLDEVVSAGASCGDSQSSISWSNPSLTCVDEIMVVANETAGIDFSPSGDGTAYAANTVYASVDQVVYKGAGTSATVTGLSNGTTYYFEIFTRKGTEWSAGVEVSCTPNVTTILTQGDVAVVGVCSNISACIGGTSAGDDEISLVFFQDITTNTEFDMTDNGWQRLNANLWGSSEGTIRVTRTGSSISKGTVITFRLHNGGTYEGVFPDNDWTFTPLNSVGADLVLNSNGDQIYFMQGGNWIDGATITSHDADYVGGQYLFAFNTYSSWDDYINTTQRSGLIDGMDCFNMLPSGATDYLKYTGPTDSCSQIAWIGRINNSANWTSYADCAAYFAGAPNYTAGDTLLINNIGVDGIYNWYGNKNTDWFDCANWGPLKIPTAADPVIIPNSTQVDTGIVLLPGEIAACKSFEIRHPDYFIKGEGDASKILDVGTYIKIERGLIDFDDENSATADGTIRLGGNWINDTLSDAFIHGNSKVIFDSPFFIQKIYSQENMEQFGNLEINNGTTNVDLNGNNVSVDGTLNLLSGDIITGADTVFVVNPAVSAITNASTASYINGHLNRKVNTTGLYSFPVGTSAQYESANINLNASSGIDNFTAHFTIHPGSVALIDGSGFPLNLTVNGTLLSEMLDYGFWTIKPDASVYTIDYDVILTSRGHTNGGSDPAQHTIVKRDDVSDDWAAYEANHDNATQTGSGTAPITAQLSNLTVFSDFAIAKDVQFPLPVQLIDFKANTVKEGVLLEWTTASEINNNGFIIERSSSFSDFEALTKISGFGNSNSKIDYQWMDKNPLNGWSYYRLLQEDFDGTLSNIGTVAINYSEIFKYAIVNQQLEVFIDDESQQGFKIEVFDALGRKVLTTQNTNADKVYVDLSHLPKNAMYLIRIFNAQIDELVKYLSH